MHFREEAVGAISKVTNLLLELKNRENSNTITLSKNLSTMVHDCTDSLALLGPVNIDLEQNSHDHIAYCLDNTMHCEKMYLLIQNFFWVMIYQK